MTRLPPAEAIRHYAAHGMAREVLARIYGAEPVARVMGDDELRAATRIVDPRSLPFGEQLRLARERQRHTQNIAAKIALSPCATTTEIEGYEGGDKQIKDKRRIKRLCDYIGVPVADMMPAILEHNDRAARMRAIYRAPTRVEIAEKRKPKVKRKPTRSRLDLTDAAPDEIAQRRHNADVMAAGVAAWRRARGLDTGAKRDPEQLAKARAAGNAARRAFSIAHPFGLTMREHAVAVAVLALPEHRCTGAAIRARAGIPRSSFSNLAMNVRSKLDRHGMTLRFDRASLTYAIVLTDQQRRDLEAIR